MFEAWKCQLGRVGAAADLGAALDEVDRAPVASELDRGREPVRPASDYDGVNASHRCTP